LRITFEGGPIENAGIRQLVPVQPDTDYEFSAYFRAQSIEGAGGPRFAIDDFYSSSTYFTSEELNGTDVWKQVSGSFKTGPSAKLIAIQIKKTPPGTAIRGRLWIDGIRLLQTDQSRHRL
jgi:hypothetical protein